MSARLTQVKRPQPRGVEPEVGLDPGRLQPPERRAELGAFVVEVGGTQRKDRRRPARELGLEIGRERRAGARGADQRGVPGRVRSPAEGARGRARAGRERLRHVLDRPAVGV